MAALLDCCHGRLSLPATGQVQMPHMRDNLKLLVADGGELSAVQLSACPACIQAALVAMVTVVVDEEMKGRR